MRDRYLDPMCGIAGVVRFDGAPASEATIAQMIAVLDHRGPDGRGIWTSGPVGFGHTRLAIIDVDGSPQPMESSDGRLHITFNGEILNYRALRTATSYPYRTNGDTEVLLALHVDRGTAMVRELRGQFAFGLHDDGTGETFLVRDHLGILPLYWYRDDSMLAFASEVKALVPALPEPLKIDESGIVDYLARRAVPAPHTLYEGVRKLRPGHVLRVTRDGQVSEERYWQIPKCTPSSASLDPRGAVDELDHVLRRSVERNLVADVPVGSYSSGGVDSSLIVALASELRGGGVETFSAGFGDEELDELPYAREVSRALDTKHHEVIVTADDFSQLWEQLAWHRDAPISEPADVAVFRLAELARKSVKVVLSGEGSDELFAGYPKYRYATLARAITAVPGAVRSPAFDALQRALPAGAGRVRTMVRALGAPGTDDVIESWFAPFTASERERLLPGVRGYGQRDVVAQADGDLVRRMLYIDCHGWLSDNLLERGDRMSMAASLELRPPFLDVDVVEFAFSLPTSMKVREGRGKWIVKELARRHLPASIVDRRKVGFRVPLASWFRTGLRDFARDVLTDPNSLVSSLMDRAAVLELLDSHESGRRNEEIRIWTLVSLEVWDRSRRSHAGGVPA
jgi:asparagine synthase (glutamine-hydrolysing)